jgi:ABC-type phosphate/phosphonate transport system substrate-binding protein
MKYSKSISLCCVFFVASIFVCPVYIQAEQGDKLRFRIGYASNSLPEIDIKDANAALEIWVKEIAKDVGASAESRIYTDVISLFKDFQNGKLDMGVTLTSDYLKAERELNAELAFSKVRGGKKTMKHLLLVHSDSDYHEIRDLKNKKIAILRKDESSEIFLNSVLLRKKLPVAKKFFMGIEEKNKPSNAILSVFFKQADACITSDTSLNTMIALNPQIGEKLRVIASSPELIETVSFFRRGFEEKYKQIVMNLSQKLQDHPRGQQILLLFQVDRLVKTKESDLDITRNYYHTTNKLFSGK